MSRSRPQAQPPLRPADPGLAGLTAIANLSTEQRASLLSACKKCHPVFSPVALVAPLHDLTGIPKATLNTILVTIFWIFGLSRRKGVPPVELGRDLVESLKLSEKSKGRSVDGAVLGYVTDLLSLDSTLGLSAKCIELAMGHQCILTEAKVYTDLRPSFPTPVENGALAAIVLHQLELTYCEHGDYRKMYFTMDSADLGKLKEQLLRAESKEKRLCSPHALAEMQIVPMQ